MDEPERDYLRQQIQSLEKANRRWKALAFFFLAAFGLFLILGMGTAYFTHGLFVLRMERMEAEQARQEAEAQAQRARQAEMQAKQAAETAAKNQPEQEATPAEGEAVEKSKPGQSSKQTNDGMKQTP